MSVATNVDSLSVVISSFIVATGVCVTRLQPNILHHPLSAGPKSPQQVSCSRDNSAFNRSNNNQDGLDTKRSDGVNWPSGNQALDNWLVYQQTQRGPVCRALELCESRGGRPGLPSLISLRFLWT